MELSSRSEDFREGLPPSSTSATRGSPAGERGPARRPAGTPADEPSRRCGTGCETPCRRPGGPPPGGRPLRERRSFAEYRAWYPAFAASGLVAPTWPVAYGGLDLPALARRLEHELAPYALGRLNPLGLNL